MLRIIGYMDSPFVRRVAISARFLGVPYAHEELSIFRDFDKFQQINPLVKVPTVIAADGQVLVDSTLIIDYLEHLSGKSLMPEDSAARCNALRVIGIGLVAGEKVAQLIYETRQRPEEFQHGPWIERLDQQLAGAVELLEQAVGNGDEWLAGGDLGQADITTAIMWRFVQHILPEQFVAGAYPGLVTHSARAEAHPHFVACPLS
jgi:glutathione S-transferase